jgi:hypothetical protein
MFGWADRIGPVVSASNIISLCVASLDGLGKLHQLVTIKHGLSPWVNLGFANHPACSGSTVESRVFKLGITAARALEFTLFNLNPEALKA